MAAKGPAQHLTARAGDGEEGAALRLQRPLADIHVPADAGDGVGPQDLAAGDVAGDRRVLVERLLAERLPDELVVERGGPGDRGLYRPGSHATRMRIRHHCRIHLLPSRHTYRMLHRTIPLPLRPHHTPDRRP